MTTLEGLILLLGLGAVPFALAQSAGFTSRWWQRMLLALPLIALGLNVQMVLRPGLAGVLAGLILVAAVIPLSKLRFATLGLLALGSPFWLDRGIAAVVGHQFFLPDRTQILLIVAGLLMAAVAGNVLVEETIKRIRGLPHSSAEAAGAQGAPAGGRVIGILERTLVYGAVLVGHPEAVALVIAFKSVARFPKYTSDREFAEYFLIGTLLSLLFGLSVAYLIRSALALAR